MNSLLLPVEKSLKHKDKTIICTKWKQGVGLQRNVHMLDSLGQVVWEIQEPLDQSSLGVCGDAYVSIWFENKTLVARTLGGGEYAIDLETGKRLKFLRFSKA
jgi:hypothetical protein